MPSASWSNTSARPGRDDGQLGGPGAHLVGEQQLAAGRRPQPVVGDLEAALVGDLEVAHLLDRVAPQLEPQRVLLGRREDVDDAAADREVAALLDQVDPGVGGGDEPGEQVVEVDLVTGPHRDRLEVAEPGDHRLQQAAHRRHHDLHRAATALVVGMRQPAQHVEAPPDGVAARAEPLVRQGLPGGEADDGVGRQQVTQGGHQALGLALGRRDGEHRTPGPLRRAAAMAARTNGRTPPGAVTSSVGRDAGAGGVDRRGDGRVGRTRGRAGRRGCRSGSRGLRGRSGDSTAAPGPLGGRGSFQRTWADPSAPTSPAGDQPSGSTHHCTVTRPQRA